MLSYFDTVFFLYFPFLEYLTLCLPVTNRKGLVFWGSSPEGHSVSLISELYTHYMDKRGQGDFLTCGVRVGVPSSLWPLIHFQSTRFKKEVMAGVAWGGSLLTCKGLSTGPGLLQPQTTGKPTQQTKVGWCTYNQNCWRPDSGARNTSVCYLPPCFNLFLLSWFLEAQWGLETWIWNKCPSLAVLEGYSGFQPRLGSPSGSSHPSIREEGGP